MTDENRLTQARHELRLMIDRLDKSLSYGAYDQTVTNCLEFMIYLEKMLGADEE